MANSRITIKRFLLFIALFLVLTSGALAGVFLSRPPVLIVTDLSFYALYGPDRFRQRQREISLSLFRRVVPVTVAENAGPDLVAIAAEEAFREPWAVLFPYRYLAGARLFKENNPEVPVLVMGGRNPKPSGLADTDIVFVRTDTSMDLYRAGVSAAFFAGEKNILIFDDGLLTEENREFLGELLVSRGFYGELLFRTRHAHIHNFAEIGSVILTGPADRFLEQNLGIPMILFSWIDPDFTPRTVKLVFDDSPWALAVKALRSGREGEILIPSAPKAISGRISERGDFRKLRDLIQENF